MVILESTGLNSSWISAAYLVRQSEIDENERPSLALEMNDGAICWYFGSDESDYQDIVRASSPGHWLYNWSQNHSYDLISF